MDNGYVVVFLAARICFRNSIDCEPETGHWGVWFGDVTSPRLDPAVHDRAPFSFNEPRRSEATLGTVRNHPALFEYPTGPSTIFHNHRPKGRAARNGEVSSALIRRQRCSRRLEYLRGTPRHVCVPPFEPIFNATSISLLVAIHVAADTTMALFDVSAATATPTQSIAPDWIVPHPREPFSS